MAEGADLRYTPTWMVAITSVFIIFISWILERGLHYIGELLKRRKLENMYEALQKIKEELMIMGFISLLLVVFQGTVDGWCIDKKLSGAWLPCSFQPESLANTPRRYLAGSTPSDSTSIGKCQQGKVPFMSLKALHDLHIFIFVLGIVQVIVSALTFAAGGFKISRWSRWERSILEEINENEVKDKVIHIQNDEFIKSRPFWGIGSSFRGWADSFIKHILGSVTKSDYKHLRKAFILKHCRGNPEFNFHRYLFRAFEMDFKEVVGINWYLWVFVVLLLLLNVVGWLSYLILSFIPLILLLVIGTKLEHIITTLATQAASKHPVAMGDLEIKPSDNLFWFNNPRIMLIIIHMIIFANSFGIAVFFWGLFTYKIDSCFVGSMPYLVTRLVVKVLVQVLSTYRTLPLYAIVTQMGSSFSVTIFEENVQETILRWANNAKRVNNTKQSRQVFPIESGSTTPVRRHNKQSLPAIEIIRQAHVFPTESGSGTPVRRHNIQSSPNIEIIREAHVFPTESGSGTPIRRPNIPSSPGIEIIQQAP